MKCEKMSAMRFEQQACYVRRRRESLSMLGTIKYHPFIILLKTKTKKMDLQERSPIFSKLPGELRAIIFEMALTNAKWIYVRLQYDNLVFFSKIRRHWEHKVHPVMLPDSSYR